MKRFFILNLSLKLLLLVLLVHVMLYPELPQYQMKGMNWRLLFYPLVVAIPSLVLTYRKFVHKKQEVYPHHIDALITLCAVTDMFGNTFDFYNSIYWWDDFMHLANTVPWTLVAGFFVVWRRIKLPAWAVAGLTMGYGFVCHILWEIAEYITFVPDNPNEYPLAYQDTIGDLSLAVVGTIIAGVIIYFYVKNQNKIKE